MFGSECTFAPIVTCARFCSSSFLPSGPCPTSKTPSLSDTHPQWCPASCPLWSSSPVTFSHFLATSTPWNLSAHFTGLCLHEFSEDTVFVRNVPPSPALGSLLLILSHQLRSLPWQKAFGLPSLGQVPLCSTHVFISTFKLRLISHGDGQGSGLVEVSWGVGRFGAFTACSAQQEGFWGGLWRFRALRLKKLQERSASSFQDLSL